MNQNHTVTEVEVLDRFMSLKQVFCFFFLVFRRRVSAKRRTIVFSPVRPSLQEIIEL